jgi:tetratricopeptide (TPR) repeat protein
MKTRSTATCLIVGSLLAVSGTKAAAVRGWEGTIDLPTYTLGEEDPNPAFPLVSHHNVYPYTMLDDLAERREEETYRAFSLENEFLKAIILPDLGGRLYSLYDKVGRREVFYRNHVVKYGLVAARGAWISGGIEFNFPDAHTVVTVSPVAARLVHNSDGSAAAVVGGMDWVTEMHWEVSLVLRPGVARLEQHVTLFNSTPLPNLYSFWANAAVPASEDMQFIYPMKEANPHSFTEIWTYPVWKGVDHSWYKDIRRPTSLFGRQVHRNFFGAYYHAGNFGVVHVADFRAAPGKKIWSWGVAGDGQIWTDLLTDRDGPYNEIQSGRYETQLTQEFMEPRSAESWTEYWYPVRGLGGGFVEATKELALNVMPVAASGNIEIAVLPTVDVADARIVVKAGSRVLRKFDHVEFRATSPQRFAVPAGSLATLKAILAVQIEDATGRTLLDWSAAQPADGNPDFVPAAGVRANEQKPTGKMSVEELFMRGVQEEKRGRGEAADRIYRQVLDHDPGEVRALLKLAWRSYRASDLPAAQDFIARALARDGTNPQLHYAAGVIDLATGRWTLAQDAFWNSIHFGGSRARAFDGLGEIAIHEKNFEQAAQLLRAALRYEPEDALTLAELAVALRLSGDLSQASRIADQAAAEMPLLPYALAEQWRIESLRKAVAATDRAAAESPMGWDKALQSDRENYVEIAAWYRNLGDLASSNSALQESLRKAPSGSGSPLVYYYLASNSWRAGETGRASKWIARAQSARCDRVFPNRLSDALVLDDVLSHHPNNAGAHYLLGTFLFAHDRYDEAAEHWIQALQHGFDDSVLQRNLGVYAWRVKNNLKDAPSYYEAAIRRSPREYRLYSQLDEIYTEIGDDARRAKLFASAPPDVLDHDTVRVRRALFLVQQRQFDQALAVLNDHHFKPWEGGEVVRQVFVLANLAKGREALASGSSDAAASDFRRALEYPPNLGVGRPDQPDDAAPWYWLGEALAAQAKGEAARAAWESAVEESGSGGADSVAFRAMALARIGRKTAAEKILNDLVAAATSQNAGPLDFYSAGLAEHFRNDDEAARRDFQHALELDPAYWQARVELGEIQARP